jgi:hypothetical protein
MTADVKFIAQIVGHLEVAEIPYMVVGSVASSIYSDPRSTNDVDIVVDPTPAKLSVLLARVSDFYVSAEAAAAALRERGMFNIIDVSSGTKADLIFLKSEAFDQSEFRRRTRDSFQGISAWMLTPEDAILSKLRWSRLSESERQFRDAFNVARVQWASLDFGYLDLWASELQVTDLWELIQAQVRTVQGN